MIERAQVLKSEDSASACDFIRDGGEKTFLVTGGAGFIGTHLCRELHEDHCQILVLDDFSNGSRTSVPTQAKVYPACISKIDRLDHVLDFVDGIFHLAAIPSIAGYTENWLVNSKVNLLGTLAVFEAAARKNIPVVYASSAAIYGAAANAPYREDLPVRPISGYGADKLAAELHAAAMHEAFGLRAVGLRLFNIYGPGQNPQSPFPGVITRFLTSFVRDNPVTVFGDGRQRRDFVHIEDAVRALKHAMALAAAGGSEILNACSGRPVSVNQVIAILSEATGRAIPVRYAPSRHGDIDASYGCPEKAKIVMGFSTQIPFEQGLQNLVYTFNVNAEN